MKVYFASPFFSDEQVEREERLKAKLRSLGIDVWSPKEASKLEPTSTIDDRKKTFQSNLENIKDCDAVFAVTDGRDVGTIWECGYAYGINKPIIYYAETLGEKKFNLMLAQSGKNVILSENEITLENLNIDKDFTGIIE